VAKHRQGTGAGVRSGARRYGSQRCKEEARVPVGVPDLQRLTPALYAALDHGLGTQRRNDSRTLACEAGKACSRISPKVIQPSRRAARRRGPERRVSAGKTPSRARRCLTAWQISPLRREVHPSNQAQGTAQENAKRF